MYHISVDFFNSFSKGILAWQAMYNIRTSGTSIPQPTSAWPCAGGSQAAQLSLARSAVAILTWVYVQLFEPVLQGGTMLSCLTKGDSDRSYISAIKVLWMVNEMTKLQLCHYLNEGCCKTVHYWSIVGSLAHSLLQIWSLSRLCSSPKQREVVITIQVMSSIS